MSFRNNKPKLLNDPYVEENDGISLVQHTGLYLSPEDRMRRIIRQELIRQAMGRAEAESFDEADDFEMDDGEEWHSPYEVEFDPVEHSETPAPAPAPVPPSDTNTPPNGAPPTPPPTTANVPGQ